VPACVAKQLALEGIAGIQRYVTKEEIGEISRAIDGEFMGVGQAFTRILTEATMPVRRGLGS
jgi:hypothetical protein